MLVLDRATPISVEEAVALRDRIGEFGIAPYIGGPCAAQVWPQDLIIRLLDQGFKMAGYWVGSNVGCWVSEWTADLGIQHAERAWRDARNCDMDKAPIILDVEYNTYEHNPQAVTEYAHAFARRLAELGGIPWLYSNQQGCNAIMSGSEFRGVVLALWSGQHTYQPEAPATPAHAAHQYANDVTDLLSDGTVDCSVFNDADLYSREAPANAWSEGDINVDTGQLAAAIVKLTYVVGALVEVIKDGKPFNANALRQDENDVDPKGFNDQVNAILQSRDPHAIVNNMLRDLTGIG